MTDNLISSVTCPPGDLAPDTTLPCLGSYVIKIEDMQLGSVTNLATAQSVSVDSTPVSETIPDNPNPSLNITKTADASTFYAVGDQITFTYTVTNTSTGIPSPALANDIFVNDDRISGPVACDPADGELLVNESATCTAIYSITQADLDRVGPGQTTGFVTNNASAQTTFGTTTIVSPPAKVTVQALVTAAPALTVLKSLVQGEPDSAFSAVGHAVTYVITVTNSGNTTPTSTTVTDSLIPGTCTIGALAPGQIDEIGEFVCPVNQADINCRSITNLATAVSQPATPGAPTVSGSDELIGSGPAIEPRVVVTKTPDLATFNAAGLTITYSYVIANIGNVTLFGPATLTDDKISTLICEAFPTGGLQPGNFISCTGAYVALLSGVDSGSVTNIANVSLPGPNDPDAVVTDVVMVRAFGAHPCSDGSQGRLGHARGCGGRDAGDQDCVDPACTRSRKRHRL